MKRVCFLLERGNPPRTNQVVADAMARLESGGIRVTVRYPEEEVVRLDRLAVDADLYILRSNTELALSISLALERLGARIINRACATALLRDKTVSAAVLLGAGIPVPRSLAAALPEQLAPDLEDHHALIFKPNRGVHGRGIAVAGSPAEIPAAAPYPGMVFVQDYLAGSRTDLKLYCIGDHVFGVRKVFGPDSYMHAGEQVEVPAGMEDVARRCGRAFGLELYGVDVVESTDGPRVVDVNHDPGYRGVPGAAIRLADYIMSRTAH